MSATVILRVAAFTSATLVTATVCGQPATMTPTPTQRAYNDRGVQHMFDGEFEQAAVSFKSSLTLGESNIAWLNYGRALFKLRRCPEALRAFEAVPAAPAVAAPSPDEIALVLDRFTAEWSAACTGRLVLECPDDETLVRIDGGEPFPCHADPIPVTKGAHEVSVDGWGEVFSVAVHAEPALLSLVRSLEPPAADDTGPVEPTAQEREVRYAARGSSWRVVGVTVGAIGIAGLGTAFALDRGWVAPAFREYEAAPTPEAWAAAREVLRQRQRANRVLLVGALGATAAGATLFFWPRRDAGVALKLGTLGPTSVAAEVTW